MAVPTFLGFFDNALKYLLDGTINLNTDTLKVCLLDNSFTPDMSLDVYGDLTHEITGDGYTAGGQALNSKIFSVNGASHLGVMDADDNIWPHLTAINIKYVVLYREASLPADKKLIATWDTGDSQSPVDVNFELKWNAGGILNCHS